MTDTDPRPGGRDDASGSGKGRPTPKRSETQRRRSGPVPPPPRTRKEAARRLREQSVRDKTSSRGARRRGYVAGDERALLPRDAGPVRSLVRDVVDARRNVGVLLLPLALMLMLARFTDNPLALRVTTNVWTAGLLAMIVDSVLIARKVRSRVREAHPQGGRLGWHVGYALLRSTAFRRFRMPPPKVGVGDPV